MSATLDRPVTGLVAQTIPFSCVDGPGNRFVVFMQGCNFDCLACHNPQTIPGHAPMDGHGPRHMSVEQLLAELRRAAPFISGVTVSGGEATQQPDFLEAFLSAVRADASLSRLTRLVDSNGACEPELWDRLAPVVDGAMIDLKCLDPEIHRAMTGHPNDQVLAAIRHLHTLDRLEEVRLLIVAGVNDDPVLLTQTARWLAAVDPDMRLRIIGFRTHGVRAHDPPLVAPTPDAVHAVADMFRGIGSFDITVV